MYIVHVYMYPLNYKMYTHRIVSCSQLHVHVYMYPLNYKMYTHRIISCSQLHVHTHIDAHVHIHVHKNLKYGITLLLNKKRTLNKGLDVI